MRRFAAAFMLCVALVNSLFVVPAQAQSGNLTCHGQFVNPLTDTCWSCLFPLTLGNIPIFKGDKPDTPNPSSPICLCPAPPPLFLKVGLAVGFWEPVRLADVTNKPYCFVSLGGIDLNPGIGYPAKSHHKTGHGADRTAYHVHWYFYPLMVWMQLLTDFLCLESDSFDIAYMTELDPLWNDDQLAAIINPEEVIFANPIATAACSVDCAAATAFQGIPQMFWCQGCQGSTYPMDGNIMGSYGQVQGAVTALERFTFKIHRMFLAQGTSGPQAVCAMYAMPILDKRQYRFQLTTPVPNTSGPFTCTPMGQATTLYEGLKSFPVSGEDFGFLIWRKRNCCVSIPGA